MDSKEKILGTLGLCMRAGKLKIGEFATLEAIRLLGINPINLQYPSDVTLNFNSYQNSDNFYRQYHYVLRPEIYSFQHH